MKNVHRVLGLWVVLIILFVAFYNVFSLPQEPTQDLTWQSVLSAVEEGKVSSVEVSLENGRGVGRGRLLDDTRFKTDSRSVSDFAALEKQGVTVNYTDKPNSIWSTIFAQWLPIVFVFLFFIFFLRKFQGKPASDLLKFELTAERVNQPVKLDGLTEVRARLKAAADAAKNGSPGPRRILIVGPPGAGKTTLLRAVAFDSGLPLLARAGSQFVEVFVGVGAARIRAFFDKGAAEGSCVLAIDDLDAFATKRVIPDAKGVVDERGATMLELANRLDGLTPFPPKVLFLATTSRLEIIDEAIVRPGRFELKITLQAHGEALFEELKRG